MHPIAAVTFDVIAAVVGVTGALVGVAGVRDARRQRREVAALRERAQAEKISAWADKRTDEGRRVNARNASDQIVRDVRVWLVSPSSAPDHGVPDRDPTTRRSVLEPGDTLEHLIPAGVLGPAPAERPSVVLTFRDADGREWIRGTDDSLTRM